MALSWQVPTTTVGNSFSVILVSTTPVTDVDAADFRLRATDGTMILLDDTLVTITQVAGTNNWRLDITLTGTIRKTYSIRLRRRQLRENGTRVPGDVLDSTTFPIDSAYKPPVTDELEIEAIDEQFIVLGTKDYALIVDISGEPDSVDATGHMEGFDSNWDASNGQLHIRAEEVSRLIAGVKWDIDARKDGKQVIGEVKYNVIPPPPIFATLPLIHLYRNVPINFDIDIANVPPLIIPNARLLGLKSELLEHGLNVGGKIPADSVFSFDSGNVTIIVPSETGETSTMHDYAYTLETGAPPKMTTPEFTPKGNYAEIEVDKVNHALGYEWSIEDGIWNEFNERRPVINPSEVEVTPGTLEVTIKFPNISNASAYEYMLESETHNVAWTRFTGTLENGFITTIIPNLEEGVVYDLSLRVASPWIGTAIKIKVYGGRIIVVAYQGTIQVAGGFNALTLWNTGTIPLLASDPDPKTPQLLKRILLPSELPLDSNSLRQPIEDMVIDSETQTAYVVQLVDGTPDVRRIYVFGFGDVANNARATLIKSFDLPSNISVAAMALFDNKLYIAQRISGSATGLRYTGYIYNVPVDTADGATAVASDVFGNTPLASVHSLAVEDDFIYYFTARSGTITMRSLPRVNDDYQNVPSIISQTVSVEDANYIRKIGDRLYSLGRSYGTLSDANVSARDVYLKRWIDPSSYRVGMGVLT